MVFAATQVSAAQKAEHLQAALCQDESVESEDLRPLAACLIRLLMDLRWRGEPRQLAEALPHFATELDLTDVRNILSNLGFRTQPLRERLQKIDRRLLPCLYVTNRGETYVAISARGDAFTVFDGATRAIRTVSSEIGPGTAFIVEPISREEEVLDRSRTDWFRDLAERFRPVVLRMLAVTFVTNMLALAVPLYVMSVYDHVIAGNSRTTLVFLVTGVLLVLSCDFGLRLLRGRALAHIGARMDYLMGVSVFRHILHLPPVLMERAPIGAQVARIREFESLRDFFTSPLATVFLELPFVVIFLIAIALLGGWLVLIPLIMVVMFLLTGLVITPHLRRRVQEASRARSKRHGFLVEALTRMHDIKRLGAELIWFERFRTLSADAAAKDLHSRILSSLLQTSSHLIMTAAAIATLAFGAILVMGGHMTNGALSATMALVWHVLSPLQLMFSSVNRIEQVRIGVQQLNQLMRLTPEREPDRVAVEKKVFRGRVTFSRVSMRYNAESEPALLGVSFDVEPGEIVAIVGPNGSGKSSLLQLVCGLNQPQAGTIAIDGINIRQVDPIELREAMAYAPQYSTEFYGTVAQNLRLAQPTANNGDLRRACQMAGILDDIDALPEGFDTRLRDHSENQLPTGFRQRISLARAYLRQAPIMLLDEPASTLDEEGDRAFMEVLQHFRGKATILFVTHRPSHLKLADKVLLINEGRLDMQGPPDEVLPKLPMNLI